MKRHGMYGHNRTSRSTPLNGCIQDPSVHGCYFYPTFGAFL